MEQTSIERDGCVHRSATRGMLGARKILLAVVDAFCGQYPNAHSVDADWAQAFRNLASSIFI